jgi:hypothetical protein
MEYQRLLDSPDELEALAVGDDPHRGGVGPHRDWPADPGGRHRIGVRVLRQPVRRGWPDIMLDRFMAGGTPTSRSSRSPIFPPSRHAAYTPHGGVQPWEPRQAAARPTRRTVAACGGNVATGRVAALGLGCLCRPSRSDEDRLHFLPQPAILEPDHGCLVVGNRPHATRQLARQAWTWTLCAAHHKVHYAE